MAVTEATDQAHSGLIARFNRLIDIAEPRDDMPPGELRKVLGVLGLPTFGLAFAMAILTTYGPVVLLPLAHTTFKVGLLLGGEGAFALFVPLLSGHLSDRMPPTKFGRRLPFVMVGGPMLVAGIVLLPIATSYLVAGLALLIFFVGYYLYYPPYRAIYADVLSRNLYARAQASQAILRGAGLGAALLAGGLLLGVWKLLPFIVVASMVGITSLALIPVSNLGDHHDGIDAGRPRGSGASAADMLLRNRKMQLFAISNSLWEFAFAGLKTFIVLYVIKGLGHSPETSSAVIAVVAVAYIVGAPIAARLADRFGIVPVMGWSAGIFGAGLVFGAFPSSLGPLLIFFPFVALAGSILLTLPQALGFLCAPDGGQGIAAGVVDFSRGVGVVLGPIAVGAAVTHAPSFFNSTHGYAAMFPVIGIANLVSLLFLYQLRDVSADIPANPSAPPATS